MPSYKRKEYYALTFRIKQYTLEISPCSSYEKNNRRCLVALSLFRCSEYIHRSRKCDIISPSDTD